MNVPAIDVRRAADRFVTSTDWLESRHVFSFGEHYDPANVGHGRLLVSNDEVVRSGRGFDDHPHRDTEIVTWVLSGSLVHEDSSGHRGIVHPGLAQRLSAGQGIVHAERNDAFRFDPDRPADPVHYIQMWLRPDVSGGSPSYQQGDIDLGGLAADWFPVASGTQVDAAVTLGATASTLWATVLAPGEQRVLPVAPYVHLYLARGEVELETVGRLRGGDSVRITGEAALRITGVPGTPEADDPDHPETQLLVWEMGP